MLNVNHLLAIKGRMLLAAETAHRVANGGGEAIELADGEYQTVMASLLSLRDDVREILAEVDILRGMVTGNYEHLFVKEDKHASGRSVSEGDVGVAGNEAGVGGGEGERPDDASVGGTVRSERPDGEASGRSDTGGNKKPRRSRKKKVDTGG